MKYKDSELMSVGEYARRRPDLVTGMQQVHSYLNTIAGGKYKYQPTGNRGKVWIIVKYVHKLDEHFAVLKERAKHDKRVGPRKPRTVAKSSSELLRQSGIVEEVQPPFILVVEDEALEPFIKLFERFVVAQESLAESVSRLTHELTD